MRHETAMHPDPRRLAEAVRAACLEAAREAYQQAALAGLCHEGAMELALDAIRALELEPLLAAWTAAPENP